MSSAWAKNLIGIRQTDFQLLQIPHPRLELGIHVTLKCVEGSALLGSIISPIYHSLTSSGPVTNDSMKEALVRGGMKGAIIGLIAGPILTAIRLRQVDVVGIYDRCYRLRFNASQLFVDRAVIIASTVGAATQGQSGFVLGVDLALLGSVLINALFKR